MNKEKGNGLSQTLNPCLSRRAFLVGTGAAAATTIFLTTIPGLKGKAVAAEMVSYPKIKIGKLSALKNDAPLPFSYPDKGPNSLNMLIKLGEPAGGGIGPQRDVVAFSTLCTHMGGPVTSYLKVEKVLGPCPFHQSTFDLTRHGIVICGHATESLPQVLLELESDDIYAVGMIGLIYGRYDNLKV